MTDEQRPQEKPLGEYAGFLTRLVAWTIDRLIIIVIISITAMVVGFFAQAFRINELLGTQELLDQIMVVVVVAVAVTIPLIYNIGSWMLAGQTLGKWVMGVRIVRTDGERLTFWNCVRRQAGYWISAILFLGYLWVLMDNRRQGWMDKIAGTFVVYSWPEDDLASRPVRDRLRGYRLEHKNTQDSA